LDDATIKNVDLVDCVVDTYSEGSALLAYGSGEATAITVENVNILATQEGASYVAGWKNVGGMIGYARNDVALTIRNCENNANVTNYGQYGAGGFVGTLTANVNNAVRFENCVNNGNITGLTYVGALVGNTSFKAKYNGFAAVNCKNTGKITYAQYFKSGYFSVFVGAGADTTNKAQLAAFTGCENTGAVSMTADQEAKLDSAYMNYATPVFDVKSFSAEISIANNGAVQFGSVEGADYYIVSFYTFTQPASSSVKIVYKVGATSGSVIIPGTVKVGEKTYTNALANNDMVASLEGESLDGNNTSVTVSAYAAVENGMDRLISAESKQVKLTEV
ncbi:MAG: hypothetical protein IJA89_01670, partial [Clostridia bacterium]|nr:hypothetical protein [Clostridia bacterium]